MSGRRIPVDLGPLTLHVMDDGKSCASPHEASIDDVLRLRAVMRGSAGSSQDFGHDHGVAGDDGEQAVSAATGRASCIAVPDICGMATLDDANVKLLASELTAALRSRSALPAGASSAVRLALRPLVLRDAELGVEDCDGELAFALWVGNTDDVHWLVLQLPRLAATLGERLCRRLRVRVFDAPRTSRLLAEQVWPTEGDA